ncbi:MAG: single-stranded-DNA-specific exonuclease RecJ [Deltaproteobacteria bacterium]|nr:MAG: single-stranded-DNA-specific exonuclease RecJ [Deltaproteobacteria bacterium]
MHTPSSSMSRRVKPEAHAAFPRHWTQRNKVSPQDVRALQEALNVHALTAHLLASRGLQAPDVANQFLQPSLRDLPNPREMMGMEAACKRLIQALNQNQRILIYGDYDVDGVSSTSLLTLYFRELGVKPDRLRFYIPHRLDHGYGLQKACFPDIAEMNCDVIVTVDCGISNKDEIDELNKMGLDVIVIDHHLPPEQLPNACAILNPKQKGCPYKDKNLAAVGVSYQLMIGLRAALRESGFFANRPEPNLRRYLDLVALGTVADIVPLQGVNRIMVHHGLKQMQHTQWPGLRALMQVAHVAPDKIDATAIGFRLGPRINAAGRMEHASMAVNLLCHTDYNEAISLGYALDEANTLRRDLQDSIFAQAQTILTSDPRWNDEHAIILAEPSWHLGVVGIVASKVMDRWHRPVIMIAIDEEKGIGKGSARSIESFNIHDALTQCSEYLVKYGGHKAAAGLTIAKENLEEFRETFLRMAKQSIQEQALEGHITYDVEFDPSQLTFALLEELSLLAPFGQSNPAPLMVASQVPVSSQRKTKDGKHLQFTVGRNIKSIAFRQGDRHPLPSYVSLAYQPQINEWQGRRNIQLNVQQID